MNRCNEKPALFWIRLLAVLSSSICMLLSVGCGGTTTGNPGADTSASEIAESSMSGAVNATEPNGTQAFYQRAPAKSYAARILDALSPIHSSYAANSCPKLNSASCTSGTSLMTYSDCNFAGSLTQWNGAQSIAFSGGCPASMTLANLNGKTLTRTFQSGTTETTLLGVSTAIDTTNSTGWDTPVSGGEQAVFTAADGSRTLTILGLHLHATTAGGTVLFDHTVSSSGTSVTGAGLGRMVSGGTITVQHNLAKFTAQAQITTALNYNVANCCHPGAGMITTTFTGSATGTETLTFTGGTSGSCGTATLVDSAGTSSSVTLSHCF